MGMTMGRPDIGLGTLVDATADSMRTAAGNEGAMGAAMGYMGMNMAGQAGAGLAQELAGSTGAANVAVTGSAGKCSGTRRWLDLFLRSNRPIRENSA